RPALARSLDLLYSASQQQQRRAACLQPDMPDAAGGQETGMAAAGRPISPHLQIYRWYLTMAISIAHRVTGLALVAGLLLISWWLIALAAGPEAFESVAWLAGSLLGEIVLFLWLFTLFFHLCNGVRHLVWDAGYGY